MAAQPAAGIDAHLEPMRWWHLEDVVAIDADAFGSTAWTLEQFYGELAAPGRWLRVLMAGEDVAGYLDVAVQGRDADLMTIVVAERFRGHGWGRRILAAAIDWALTAGAHRMFLEVRDESPAADLYRSAGFVVIDRRVGYYGEGVDALVMRRVLAPGMADGDG